MSNEALQSPAAVSDGEIGGHGRLFPTLFYGVLSLGLALVVTVPLIWGMMQAKEGREVEEGHVLTFLYVPQLYPLFEWEDPTQSIFPNTKDGFSSLVVRQDFSPHAPVVEKLLLMKPREYEPKSTDQLVFSEQLAELPLVGYGVPEVRKGFAVEPPHPVTEEPKGIFWTSRDGYFLDNPPQIDLQAAMRYREEMTQNRTRLEVIPSPYQPRIVIRESCGSVNLDELALLSLRNWLVHRGGRWTSGPSVPLDVYWYLNETTTGANHE